MLHNSVPTAKYIIANSNILSLILKMTAIVITADERRKVIGSMRSLIRRWSLFAKAKYPFLFKCLCQGFTLRKKCNNYILKLIDKKSDVLSSFQIPLYVFKLNLVRFFVYIIMCDGLYFTFVKWSHFVFDQ